MNKNDAVPEQELIRRFLGGEQWAFEKLMTLHQEPVYRVALGMLGDHDRASDITQETFIRAFRSLKDFRFRSQFATWLHRIAVNLCLSQIRRDRIRQTLSLTEIAQRLVSPRDRPDQDLALKDLAGRIEAAIASLPSKQRAVFLLRHYEELPYAQIAAIMERSEEACRANYHQALRKLRGSLQDHEDDEET